MQQKIGIFLHVIKGCRNHNNNKIAHTTLSGILSNPKYKGYYVGNKVKVVDMFTKKQEVFATRGMGYIQERVSRTNCEVHTSG